MDGTLRHRHSPTRAQLQAAACICCGREDGDLMPAGHVYTPTGEDTAPLGWAVVVCARHAESAQ